MAIKAKKMPSGNWWVQLSIGKDESGKNIRKSFTAPTKAEAEYAAAQYKMQHKKVKESFQKMTVRTAIEKYIKLSAVLSPTTIDGYRKMLRTGFQTLLEMRVDKLTDEICQNAINAELLRPSRRGGTVSPKTIINEWGLISSALRSVAGIRFDVRLPKAMKKAKIYPDPEIVINAVLGTSIELPCLLALWLSFSMSEIRGLKYTDITGDIITINRVKVDVEGYPTVKENAKVDTRLRSHVLPTYILDLVKASPGYGTDDFIVTQQPGTLRRGFQRIMRAKGYEMTFHDLRHLNASVMLALNVPDKYAMERGGWKTPHVMKSVYQHTFSKERITVDQSINDYFEKIIIGNHKTSENR